MLHINDDTHERFPLNTLLCNNNKPFSEGLLDLFSFVPILQVEDMNGILISAGGAHQGGEKHVFFFRALNETINILWFGLKNTWGCPFSKTCKLPIKDKLCDTTPWIRGKNIPTCSQGAVAIYLAIHNKSIKYAHHGKPFVPLVPDH